MSAPPRGPHDPGRRAGRFHTARGPMGLRELTTYKYVIQGSGQIRS